MALVSLVSPEINAESPFDPAASAVVNVDATLTGTDSNPVDWTLKASSFTFPGGNPIDEQLLTNAMGTQTWSGSVNAGLLSTGKPTSNNIEIRVKAEKSTGGAGGASGQIKCWIEDSCSSSSSDSSDSSSGMMAKAKMKPPLKVTAAKAAMAKATAKPPLKSPKKATPAKKAATVKKVVPPAKKPTKKK